MPRRPLRPSPRLPGLVVLLAGLLPCPLGAQQLVEQLRPLAKANAEAYAAPLTRGLAHSLARGSMDRASVLGGLRFDVGVRFVGARPPAEDEVFQVVLPDSVVYRPPGSSEDVVYRQPYRPRDGAEESPTVAGEGPGSVLVPDGDFEDDLIAAGEDPEDFAVALPDGLSLPVIPTMTLHGSLGIGMGTELTAHMLPPVEVLSEVGDLRSHGATVSHEVSRWFPSPADLLVTAGFQEGRAGDFLRSSALHYGGMGGVSAGPLSLFGGLLLRRASTRVRYRVENPDDIPGIPADGAELAFRTDAGSGPAWVVGARLQLLILNLGGHYAMGPYDVFSLKVGLGLP
ncbi:MAG: DUF6588 family protein [Gemmatimonadota bacterium]